MPPTDSQPDLSAGAPTDPYAVWRIGSFRLYAVSWFLIVFGKQIETIAVLLYIHRLLVEPQHLGYVGGVQALPVMLLAIPAGQMADRLDRRRVILSMIGLSTLVALGLFVLVGSGLPPQWTYLLLFVGAIGGALGGPSRSALLPQIVPAARLSNAVAWNSSVFQIASMTGPAVGGFLFANYGATVAFATVVVCRLLALTTVFFIESKPVDRADTTISVESLVAGIRFVFRNKLILAPITLDMFAVLFGGATYLLPIFSDILGAGEGGAGYLRSAEAVGAVAMAMLITHLPPMRRAGRAMLWAVAGYGVATIIFGLSRSFWLSMSMMFLIGALDNISVVVRHTLVQMLTPDEMRGRVSAVNNVFIVASNDLGGLESGLTAWLVGPVWSVVAGGIGTILCVSGASWLWPQIRELGSLHQLQPVRASEIEGSTQPAEGP